MNQEHKHDCFISHASEDKKSLVEPLAMELNRLGVRVWFDQMTIKVGDSLSRSIDEGLTNSRYGILIISKAFLSKPWPEYELRGLIAREIGRKKVILPVWYGVTRDDVVAFSPPLSDKLALLSTGDDINALARNLIEVVRPDLYPNIHRIEALQKHLQALPVKTIALNEVKLDTKIYHPTLTPQQVVRIRNVHYILREVDDTKLDAMILNFKKDLLINEEIFIWEGIAAAWSNYKIVMAPSEEELREAFRALLHMSMGMIKEVLADETYAELNQTKRGTLLVIWSKLSEEVVFVGE